MKHAPAAAFDQEVPERWGVSRPSRRDYWPKATCLPLSHYAVNGDAVLHREKLMQTGKSALTTAFAEVVPLLMRYKLRGSASLIC